MQDWTADVWVANVVWLSGSIITTISFVILCCLGNGDYMGRKYNDTWISKCAIIGIVVEGPIMLVVRLSAANLLLIPVLAQFIWIFLLVTGISAFAIKLAINSRGGHCLDC
jgi:hypothetical protein